MRRKRCFLLLLLCCLPLISGCMTSANPLSKAEATPVPGLNNRLHAASASDTNVDVIQASLYYRFMDQPLLAAETRTLTVPRDESMELAIVKALLEGPSAGHSDLEKLFPDSAAVESVALRDHVLFVTFNEALLTDDGIPQDWAQQESWTNEAPLRRRLTIQSLVASITESFPYTGVQILVHQTHQNQASLRLDNSYFLSEATGLSEPQLRDESLLITPLNGAVLVLEAWKSRDTETLYAFLCNNDSGTPKGTYQEIALELDHLPPLSDYEIHGGGSVSSDGQKAVLTVDLALLGDDGETLWSSYPLSLTRENDLWRLRYSVLQQFMSP